MKVPTLKTVLHTVKLTDNGFKRDLQRRVFENGVKMCAGHLVDFAHLNGTNFSGKLIGRKESSLKIERNDPAYESSPTKRLREGMLKINWINLHKANNLGLQEQSGNYNQQLYSDSNPHAILAAQVACRAIWKSGSNLKLNHADSATCCLIPVDRENRNGNEENIGLRCHYPRQDDESRHESFESEVEEVVHVGKEHVARIIGSKGAVIKALQAVTKARIRIEQHNLPSEDAPRPLHVAGGFRNVAHAKQLVQTLMLAEGERYKDQVSALLDRANASNMIIVEVPQMVVGRLKGRGGEIIRQLTAITKTKIDIDPNTSTDVARITIKGMNQMDIRKSQDSILDLCIGSGRGSPAFENLGLIKSSINSVQTFRRNEQYNWFGMMPGRVSPISDPFHT